MGDIVLKFRGKTYTIPESRAFAVGSEVENVVTLGEMAGWGNNPRFFKIASAFGVMLRFAGCKVSDGEIKAEIDVSIRAAISADVTEGDAAEVFAVTAVQQLQAVLFQDAPGGDDGSAPEKTTASSRRRSR